MSKVKAVLFLNTGSDSEKAEDLKDYLQIRVSKLADLRNITDIIAEDQELRAQLRQSHCVVFIGSRQASEFIQNQQQEIEDDYVTFDGKLLYKEFTKNEALVKKTVVVFLTERNKEDWIPPGVEEGRIFSLYGEYEKIGKGNPELDRLEDCFKGMLGVNTRA